MTQITIRQREGSREVNSGDVGVLVFTLSRRSIYSYLSLLAVADKVLLLFPFTTSTSRLLSIWVLKGRVWCELTKIIGGSPLIAGNAASWNGWLRVLFLLVQPNVRTKTLLSRRLKSRFWDSPTSIWHENIRHILAFSWNYSSRSIYLKNSALSPSHILAKRCLKNKIKNKKIKNKIKNKKPWV